MDRSHIVVGRAGDISFGDAAASGPLTSYARHLTAKFDCYNCQLKWPPGNKAYKLTKAATGFRMTEIL